MMATTTATSAASSATTTLHIRRGCVKCGCKQVEIHLVVPPTSYSECDHPSFLCHCNDCVGVPTALNDLAKYNAQQNNVEEEGSQQQQQEIFSLDVVDRSCNAVHQIFFYNSDVFVQHGKDLIGFHKLTPKAPIIRFYAKCCLTPLGFRRPNSTTIYGKLIQPMTESMNTEDENNDAAAEKQVKMVGDVFPSPSHAVFRSRAPEGSGPVPEGVIVRSLNIAPMAIIKLLRWEAIGKRLHKMSDAKGVELPTLHSAVLVGWDAINHQNKTRLKKKKKRKMMTNQMLLLLLVQRVTRQRKRTTR